MDISKRENDLEKLITKLDITPTMYKNATEKYQAIANFLQSRDIEADFYPQGSFRLGTVIRPYRGGKEGDYDLDVICKLTMKKEETTAGKVKNLVGQELKNSEVYSDKLQPEMNRCWTLKYADVSDGVGFMLDIVPSVYENTLIIDGIIKIGVAPEYANEAIAITNLSGEIYNWVQSNPKGYALWFDEINKPFFEFNRENRRIQYFTEHRDIYASVEEVPAMLERSALQRVIQILKRHRDIYYTRANCWSLRPISAIITTISSQIAQNAPTNFNVFELLEYVASELYIYASLLEKDQLAFEQANQQRTFIKKSASKWYINNPVNPNDNYADSWDNNTARRFFQWVSAVKSDFIDTLQLSEERYINGLESGLGTDLLKVKSSTIKAVSSPIIVSQTKPWSNNGR